MSGTFKWILCQKATASQLQWSIAVANCSGRQPSDNKRLTDSPCSPLAARRTKEKADIQRNTRHHLWNSLSPYAICCLVSPENITCIDLLRHVVKTRVVAVGYDRVALGLESREVIHHTAAEKGRAVLQ